MKPIKTTATVALMALSPLAAQAMPVTVPMTAPAPTAQRDPGQVQPVFLDLRQLERDIAVLLNGNGGNGGGSRDWSRDGNSRDGNSDDRNGGDSNGGNSNGGSSNGGNSGGGNGGDS